MILVVIKKKELLKQLKIQLKNKTLNNKNIEYNMNKGKIVHIKKINFKVKIGFGIENFVFLTTKKQHLRNR